MTPEDQAYVREHNLDQLIQAMMMAMLRSKPKDPMSFLVQKLTKLQNKAGRASSGQERATSPAAARSSRPTSAARRRRRKSMLKKRPTGLEEALGEREAQDEGPDSEQAAASHMSLDDMLEEEEAPLSARHVKAVLASRAAGKGPGDDDDDSVSTTSQQSSSAGNDTGQPSTAMARGPLSSARDNQQQQQQQQQQQNRRQAMDALALAGEEEDGLAQGVTQNALEDSASSDDDAAAHGGLGDGVDGEHVGAGGSGAGRMAIIHCPSCGVAISMLGNTPALVGQKHTASANMWSAPTNAIRFVQNLHKSSGNSSGNSSGTAALMTTARKGSSTSMEPQESTATAATGGDGWGGLMALTRTRRRFGATLRLNDGEKDELGNDDDDDNDDDTIMGGGRGGGQGIGALLSSGRVHARGRSGAGSATSTTRYRDPRKGAHDNGSGEGFGCDEDALNADSVYGDGGGGRETPTRLGPYGGRRVGGGSRPGASTPRGQGQQQQHAALVSTWRTGGGVGSGGSGGGGQDGFNEEDEDAMSIATGVDADDELEAFFRSSS